MKKKSKFFNEEKMKEFKNIMIKLYQLGELIDKKFFIRKNKKLLIDTKALPKEISKDYSTWFLYTFNRELYYNNIINYLNNRINEFEKNYYN